MASTHGGLRRMLPALSAAVPITVIFIAVLSIILTAAGSRGLGLSGAQTSSWIAVIYGLPAIPSVLLTVRYREPMLLTGNVFAIIFFASLGHQFTFAELCGASLIAGAIVVLAAVFGLTRHLAAWIPASIVQGLIAGAVMPFVAGIFSALSTVDARGVSVASPLPAMVGAALVAYLLSQRVLGPRLPPILPALVAGLTVAVLTGGLGPAPTSFVPLDLTVTRPEFSVGALASVVPVLVALITLQSNLPSIVYLRSQGFQPPERVIDLVSGVGTMVGSFLGPSAISLALPLVPLTAGPGAGEHALRYRSVFVPAGALLLIAFLAGTAAGMANLVPPTMLLALAGLALVGALVAALQGITRGPLVLGPIFAFATALSKMSLLGLGPFFWSLVVGIGVSLLLERDEWNQLHAGAMGDGSPDTERQAEGPRGGRP
jgi:benzoate membrane transport protein